ncbi:hypothetical protein [Deinococcus puniceus]|uniref:Uncharacterized protein n=1 Tax=Deinococcus puniceus TaxID=1182568 RepID=A0A172T8Y5_9DEIO|nr:hypothetical protein [Deinococcus puniceus]ANE43406.1 hypothetical protein SU48_06085 [Deinococcus puniceus]
MNGEDWTTGIEHEAQSVNDPVWAAQARQLARRQRFWASAGRVALAVLVVEAVLLLLNALTVQQGLSAMQSRPWFTTEVAWSVFSGLVMVIAFLCVGVILGLSRVSPRLSVPLAVAFPLFQIINGALVPRPGKPFPGSPLEAADLYPRPSWTDLGPWMAHPWFWIQVVIISLSIWAGIRLVTRWRATRTLALA